MKNVVKLEVTLLALDRLQSQLLEANRYIEKLKKEHKGARAINTLFKAKRIDSDAYVIGHYFVAPLTDENSGLPSESGWFFLAGYPKRHCLEVNGVVYTIDGSTLEEYAGEMCFESYKQTSQLKSRARDANTCNKTYQ